MFVFYHRANVETMPREVITVSIGQAGAQLGQTNWEQYCAEHKIEPTGNISKDRASDDYSFRCFFNETEDGLFVPRNLTVDLEPNVIDDIKIR